MKQLGVMAVNISAIITTNIPTNPSHLNPIRLESLSQTDSTLDNLTGLVNASIGKHEKVIDPTPEWKIVARFFVKWGMMANVVMFMLGMGATLTWSQITDNVWPPYGMLIGLFGQFCMLPLLAVSVSLLFKLDPYVAMGCLIMASSPGGAYSTFGTYWMDGQTGLSVIMTACSSIMAFIIMPVNLYIYSPLMISERANIVVPYRSIIMGLVMAAGPVLIGMMLHCCSRKMAEFITKITSLIGCALSAIVVGCYLALYWKVYYSAPLSLYLISISLPIIGFTMAYLLAFLLRRSHDVCRTVGIETGCQNMSVATGIIILSFDTNHEVLSRLLLFPSLYGIFMLIEIFIGIGIYQGITYILLKNSEVDTDEEETEKMLISVWPSSKRPSICLPGALSNNGLLNYNMQAQKRRSQIRRSSIKTASFKI